MASASERLRELDGWQWIALDPRAEIIAVVEAAECVRAMPWNHATTAIGGLSEALDQLASKLSEERTA